MWRLDRRNVVGQLREHGVAVVRWAGAGSLDLVLRDIAIVASISALSVKLACLSVWIMFLRVTMLRLLAEGRGNSEIARQINVSEKTVRNRLSTVYSVLGVADRVQAVLLAREKGLVDTRAR